MVSVLDLDRLRAQFPALASGFVYLDNAGGSQTLASVADRIRDYLLTTNVQLGASYPASVASAERVRAAARATARYVGAESEAEIVLGPSTTQLLHNLALAMQDGLRPGDEVIVSTADHEANAGPWKRLQARGVVVKEWRIDRETWRLEARGLEALLTTRTRLVAFTHASNLLGSVHDVAALTRLAHAHGARVCVDGVAYAPHRRVDVAAWDVDYYVFSFYKVFGPHMAVLYGKRAALDGLANINHHFLGASAGPYKLQPGNVNFELSHGLGGIYEYVDDLGGPDAAFDAVAEHEERLAERLLAYLRGKRGVRIHGERDADRARRVPTVSFTVEGRTPESIVRAVDAHGVGIRHGDFYARRLVEELGVGPTGVVRVSAVHYNTVEEMDRAVAAIDRAIDRPAA
jgi:cysteine desulfurase family protein (TIGR01976 family)